VAIIGAGLTGCATAYACAAAGLGTIVVEAGLVGEGSSGRSSGLSLPEPGPAFRDLSKRHGLRAARRIFDSWRRASLDAALLLRRLKIPCHLDPCEHVTAGFTDGEKMLRREFDVRKSAGLDVRWLHRAAVTRSTALESATAGLRLGGGFTLDPYRASIGMATAARARGARFFERSAVWKLRPGRKVIEVATADGLVTAATAIVCTGLATREFTPLLRHFKRREKYLVMTEPVPAAIRRQLWGRGMTVGDAALPRHMAGWTRDNRLVVSGADREDVPARQRDAVRVQRTGQLMYELLTMYPVISGLQPAYGWESAYGETADGVMYIGPHRNYPRHLFALGGGAHSLAGAFLAARLLLRAAMGEPAKGDEVFGWTR
jgi:glycine/D-amino acid oxidase-like deaminating enzyme